MLKFKATKLSAFLTGFFMGFFAVAFDLAKKHALISFNFDSPRAFPVVAVYFFFTTLIFVIGPQILSMERIPFTGFPKNRAAWMVMVQAWGRMVAWFIGAIAGTLSLMPLTLLLP